MGLSVMLHLLRYRELAVVHYSGVPCALHLQHAQQSLNSGYIYFESGSLLHKHNNLQQTAKYLF